MKEQRLLSNKLPPETIAWLQRRFSLHLIIWLLCLGCFFVAWNRGLALLYGLTSLCLSLLLISQLMPRLQLRGIGIERSMVGDLTAGNDGELVYRISTEGRRYHLEITDQLPFTGGEQKLFITQCDKTTSLHTTFYCNRRGRFLLDQLTLSSSYPFGIVRHSRQLTTDTLEVLVLPQIVNLNRIPLPVIADANSDGDLNIPQQGGQDEFAAVREYTQGDSLRHVHWRASARQQQLVVKEYERSDRPVLLVTLDCRPAFNQGEGSRSTFEYAISIAASMIHYASREGMQSMLVVENGDWHDTVIPAYTSDLYDLYAFLATLESNGSQSCSDLIEQAAIRFPQANLITGFRLQNDSQLPVLPPYLTHIDIEMDAESFLFPLRNNPTSDHHREGNRLIYPVNALTPLQELFQ
ncbi:MAG: DUF58 domain-containing protein [Candidatus Thiodiazotropha lotti]|nr:DUF58 domain-containing protein [Candidatus Thiodiazotropha lotti]